MRVLGIIPARGGSKGIPRKNIRLLAGKPLIQYTIERALAAKKLSELIISTDDIEIANIGKRLGVRVPFIRPSGLAKDNTPTLPVVVHALMFLEDKGENYDAICLLQPTNPFRAPELIDDCIEKFLISNADTLISVSEVPHRYNPHWVYFEDRKGVLRISTGELSPIPRRQELPPAYYRDGSIYITKKNIIYQKNSLYGDRTIKYLVVPGDSITIDSNEDWQLAEKEIQRRNSLS